MLTISELAATTGVSAHTLRYYEREALMPEVGRETNGHRRYGEEHVFWVAFLKRLRAIGMSIAEIKEYAELVRQGDRTLGERQRLLGEHRRRLERRIASLQDHLELLDLKLQFYGECETGTRAGGFLPFLSEHGRDAHGARLEVADGVVQS